MNDKGTFFLPEAASSLAGELDSLYYFIHWICVFFFFLILAMMVYFVLRYRRKSEDETTPNFTHHTPLETFWSVVPALILVVIFFWGFGAFMNLRIAPGHSYNIYVTAQRWFWAFDYPTGVSSTSSPGAEGLVVPVNQPVKLTMKSQDLLHSFFIPQFRVKQDVLPNRYTTLWFEANKVGEFDLYCTEYCGDGHSEMIGKVHVKSQEDFNKWVQTGFSIDIDQLPLPQRGEIMVRNNGCLTCHTTDGKDSVGPTFKGLFGKTETLATGGTVVVDESYIHESLMEPMAKVVAGRQPTMPTFKGRLKEKDIQGIIEYIKTLK